MGTWTPGPGATSGNDTFIGDAGADIADGLAGNDTLSGGDGNDALRGGDGADSLDGGEGNDQLQGDPLAVGGGGAADTLNGGGGDDTIVGSVGADFLTGGDANDILHGGEPSDSSFYYDVSADTLLGGAGNDVLFGGPGADSLNGDDGDDAIVLGEGYATTNNGVSTVASWLFDTSIGDVVDGGAGIDTAHLGSLNSGAVTFDGSGDTALPRLFQVGGAVVATVTNVERFWLIGGSSNDVLTGGALNDTINSGAGADTIDGGAGNDALDGALGNDTVNGGDGNDTVSGGEGNNLVSGGAGADYVNGLNDVGGSDTLSGGDGNDIVRAYGGDIADGGVGVDILELYQTFLTSDVIVDLGGFAGSGAVGVTDGTISAQSFEASLVSAYAPNNTVTVIGSEMNDTIAATAISASIQGRGGSDLITGTAQGDTLSGGAGADTVHAGDGEDIVAAGSWSLTGGGVLEDTVKDLLYGDSGNDSLYGGAEDTFDGGTEFGGLDFAQISMTSATASLNIDFRMQSNGVTIILATGGSVSGIEKLQVTLGAGNDVIQDLDTDGVYFGGDGNDIINGFGGADRLNGQAGADALSGGDGDDLLDGGSGADVFDGGAGVDTVTYASALAGVVSRMGASGQGGDAAGDTFTSIENLIGSRFSDELVGNSAANVIEGDQGADAIDGGAGVDMASYSVSGAGVTVTLGGAASGGDAAGDVLSNFEGLRGSGFADALTGDGGANRLEGLAGDDVLQGSAGNDTLLGGLGSDSYGVDAAGDVVTENVGEGFDAVYASLDYTLGANLEGLNLIGGAINGYGNALANAMVGNALNNLLSGDAGDDVLTGDAGDDILQGGAGNDIMFGGLGSDSYGVDTSGDAIGENVGEGFDAVYSTGDYTLGANLEQLNLIGTAVNGFGNGLANSMFGNDLANYLGGGAGDDVITGGAGNDILEGNTGNDIMFGGLGSDSYGVDSSGDAIGENVGEGFDAVYATGDYTLGANLEQLNLIGSAVNGFGNALANALFGNELANYLGGGDGDDVLTGNGGNDIIEGAAGNDIMFGGLGSDSYGVDSSGDAIGENVGEGFDAVYSTASYTLGANLEQLNLIGTATEGYGNGLANAIFGNALDNILNGGTGDDVLSGGAGNDTFLFLPGAGHDVVSDFVAGGTDDRVDLSAYAGTGITYTLTQTGADAVFNFSNGDQIVLVGVNSASLVQSGDFWL